MEGLTTELIHVPEPILEPPRHILQVAHPAGAGGLAALGLLAPLVRACFGGGVSAGRTGYETSMTGLEFLERKEDDALLCCLWKARLPQRLQSVCDLVCLLLPGQKSRGQIHPFVQMQLQTHPKDEVPGDIHQRPDLIHNGKKDVPFVYHCKAKKEIEHFVSIGSD